MDPGTFSAQGDPTIMSSAGGGGCIIFKNNFSQEHAVEAPFLLNLLVLTNLVRRTDPTKEYISLLERTAPPFVFRGKHSPNLSPLCP